MNYQVLARKWRPRFFREMVGQEHVLQALINALDRNRLHHAYLFTGTRGVGKTTIARILAKCLNCEAGVSSEPCGQCSACREINDGCFIDLIEVDAASRTKVEDTRELLDNVQYAPSKGRYKVYLIDEVHMLSSHSFNALLKTLEEPPPHVKFLLATTDPHKLPATILSRCLQFHLKNMVPERIVAHLKHVLQQEMIDFEEPALWALARAADGSMRDALSLTDQAISFGCGRVFEAEVRSMLGTIDQQTVYRLAEALVAHDAHKVLATIEAASEQSPDYAGVLDELLLLLHRMTIAQMVPAALDNSLGDRERVLALAQSVTAEELQLFYQMGVLGKRDLTLAPDLRSGIEMSLLRMLAFRPEGVREPGGNAFPVTAAAAHPTVTAVAAPRLPEADSSAKKPEAAVAAETRQQQSTPPPVSRPAAADSAGASGSQAISMRPRLFSDNDHWVAGFQGLPFSGLVKAIAAECVLLSVDRECWTFSLDKGSMHLYNDKYAEQMADVLSRYFSQPVKVSIVEKSTGMLTPAAYISNRKQAAYEGALQELQGDPVLQRLITQYSAKMDPDSIEAIDVGESE